MRGKVLLPGTGLPLISESKLRIRPGGASSSCSSCDGDRGSAPENRHPTSRLGGR